MAIPTPSATKKPILKYLSKSRKPVKISHITDSMGKQFKLSKKEIEEQMPKGGRKFATKIGVAVEEMKKSGLVKSTGRGFVEITAKGRTGLKTGAVTDGRKKPGPKAKAKPATNGRKRGRPGRPPKAKVKTKNGRRKPGRPKMKTAKQSSATPDKRDDKTVQRTTEIVASYVGKNSINAKQVPRMIETVYATLQGLGSSQKPVVKRKYTKRKRVARKKA